MSDEDRAMVDPNDGAKVEYSVKELLHLMNGKMDTLDRKVEQAMNFMTDLKTNGTPHVQALQKDFDQLETRVRQVETTQVGSERLLSFQREIESNRTKAHIGIAGTAVAFIGVLVDVIIRLIKHESDIL